MLAHTWIVLRLYRNKIQFIPRPPAILSMQTKTVFFFSVYSTLTTQCLTRYVAPHAPSHESWCDGSGKSEELRISRNSLCRLACVCVCDDLRHSNIRRTTEKKNTASNRECYHGDALFLKAYSIKTWIYMLFFIALFSTWYPPFRVYQMCVGKWLATLNIIYALRDCEIV